MAAYGIERLRAGEGLFREIPIELEVEIDFGVYELRRVSSPSMSRKL